MTCPYEKICSDYESALKILKATFKQNLTAKEISEKTKIPIATVHRICKRLYSVDALKVTSTLVTTKKGKFSFGEHTAVKAKEWRNQGYILHYNREDKEFLESLDNLKNIKRKS